MTARVVTVHPESPIAEAAQLMLDSNVSGLPVIDTAGNIVGIVTEHDLLRHANGSRCHPPHWLQFMINQLEVADESARFHEAKVAEVMTRNPLTVTVDTPIEEACGLIEKHGFKRLPVVRDGRLVGSWRVPTSCAHWTSQLARSAMPTIARPVPKRGWPSCSANRYCIARAGRCE
jgi:CBS domain-containing protein